MFCNENGEMMLHVSFFQLIVEDVVKRPHVLCGCLAGIAEIFKSGTRAHLADLGMYCFSIAFRFH